MQRSWLNDVSPPSSICTSMDFQNNDNMLNSLITSSDFTNVSFLLNGSVHENVNNINNNNINNNNMNERRLNGTVTVNRVNNATVTIEPNANVSRNLMEFTFDVNKTITNEDAGTTFIADSEPPIKEFGIENADIQLNSSTEDVAKNLTFNKYDCNNLTWDKIQNHHVNATVVQSTPVHSSENANQNHLRKEFDDTISPISSFYAQALNEGDDEGEIILRSVKGKKLLDVMDDYRNSMEDQCEFLLNEETIKLSTRVYGSGETYECLDDIKSALITSADANEKEFDEMLDTFNVTKSRESEKLLQSVDSIKQRHSLINMEKQREEKQKRDCENDNRTQYDISMNKSSERLLNRRSRLFDDVNLQLQKQQQQQQQIETSVNRSASPNNSSNNNNNTIKNHNSDTAAAAATTFEVIDAENDEVIIDKNDRDRFKTIKLSRPRLQQTMVVIDTEQDSELSENVDNEISPGSNKKRRNQLNQQRQEETVAVDYKKPPPVSKLSKFGFTRPTYRPRNGLNLPLKASSTDSLDNDSESSSSKQPVSNLKSPMGIKSKSIHNLMYNGAQNGLRMTSNLKYNSETTKSQSSLKAPRASSLVRPSVESNFKVSRAINLPNTIWTN